MKLICLNAWGGIHKNFFDFVKEQGKTVDIFCFQEIYESDRKTITPSGYRSNLLNEIAEILPEFDYIFSPQFSGRDFHFTVDYHLSQGLAIFWRNTLKPTSKGDIFIFGKINEITPIEGTNNIFPPRNLQFVEFNDLIVTNLHGYWAPLPKFDTPQRIKQSELILDFLKKYKKPKIIAGDFNLNINTRSINMLEEEGFRNLVRDSGANTTRSSLYDIKWRENDKFADYVFTSNDLKVKDFKVMNDEISDHLPLLLEF
jgi:endonuclease/exonuclease/phosphatase family metal-dependent hydrolase